MHTMKQLTLVAGFAALCVAGNPSALQAQRSGVEIWANTCGRCHTAQPPIRYTAKDWNSIGTHMIVTARLTTAQGEAVLEFLRGGALQTMSAGSAGTTAPTAVALPVSLIAQENGTTVEEVFQKQCVACHGATGRGDGPAAIAFNPRPADLTDPATLADRTDEDLLRSIAEGVGNMPPFAAQLSRETMIDLVRYVRSLSSTGTARAGRETP